jgi:hypothetical protein
MLIIGCDYHPSFQQIACVDSESGEARGLSQEDMISFGFSARHWQQIEAERPITVTTLLRICEVFQVPVARLLQALDKGIYSR